MLPKLGDCDTAGYLITDIIGQLKNEDILANVEMVNNIRIRIIQNGFQNELTQSDLVLCLTKLEEGHFLHDIPCDLYNYP